MVTKVNEQVKGTLVKMPVSLKNNHAHYQFVIGERIVPIMDFIGKVVELEFSGHIYCLHSGLPISKSYNQGYSYEASLKLAACDSCIVKPEQCHFHLGTCREPQWALNYCFQPHYLYLSLTSGIKIGITRQTQIPTRWIDQGAVAAVLIGKVPSRRMAGLIESQIAQEMDDKTSWTKMLKGQLDEPIEQMHQTMLQTKEQLLKKYKKEFAFANLEPSDNTITQITYPGEYQLEKVQSYNLDKQKMISSTLLGIKGQYLIFADGVINIRKYQGYEISLKLVSQ